MRRKAVFMGGLLIGACFLAAPPPAHASFMLEVSTTGGAPGSFTTYTSNDGGNSWLNSSNVNVGGSVSVAALTIKALSTDFLSGFFSSLDLTVSGAQANQSYNLVVRATITDVPTSPSPQSLSWNYTSSSSLSGLTEHAQGWIDQSNTPFGTSNLRAATGSLTAPSSGSTLFSATPPYSWTEEYTLTGTGVAGHQISADNNETITTPLPSGLVMALTGVPVLGFGAWRRGRRTPVLA
jgi:hypothetical protein